MTTDANIVSLNLINKMEKSMLFEVNYNFLNDNHDSL